MAGTPPRPNDARGAVRDGARMPTPSPSSAPRPRRPKTTIALWLLLVVGCTATGAHRPAPARSASPRAGPASRPAPTRCSKAAGLQDPAAEQVLVRSGDPAATRAAAAAVTERLAALPEVADGHRARRRSRARDRRRAHRARRRPPARGSRRRRRPRRAARSAASPPSRADHPGVSLRQAGAGVGREGVRRHPRGGPRQGRDALAPRHRDRAAAGVRRRRRRVRPAAARPDVRRRRHGRLRRRVAVRARRRLDRRRWCC